MTVELSEKNFGSWENFKKKVRIKPTYYVQNSMVLLNDNISLHISKAIR